MVEVRKNFAAPLNEAMLFDWHTKLMAPFARRMAVGHWRTHEDPMQIVSGPIDKRRVHFEAPPSATVPAEMAAFIHWFNDSSLGGRCAVKSPPVRAALAHIYFETIHPFEDGNCRIGRALSEKALSQGLGRPVVMSLSKAIEADRKAYYAALGKAQTTNEVTDWIVYFVRTIIAAQDDAEKTIGRVLLKAKIFDRYRGQLNDRQMKILSHMLEGEPADNAGTMRTQRYMKMTGASKATAARDLQQLAELGLIKKIGAGRGTQYEIGIDPES